MSIELSSLQDRFSGSVRLRKSTGEATIVLLLGILGVFAVVYSQQLPAKNPFGAGLGPRFFPQLAGTVMAIISAYLLILQTWRRRNSALDDEVLEMKTQDIVRVGVFLILTIGYMLMFVRVGFLISTSSYLFLAFVLNGLRRYLLAAVLAVGFTIATYIAFTVALGLPVPAPILSDLFAGVL